MDDINAVYGTNDSERGTVVAHNVKDGKEIHGVISILNCIYHYENKLSTARINDYTFKIGVRDLSALGFSL